MKQSSTQLIVAVYDGMTYSVGGVLAMILLHLSTAKIFNIVVGLAAGVVISTTYGQYLQSLQGNKDINYGVGFALAAGILLPALPFLLWHGFMAYAVSIISIVLVCNYVGGLTRGRTNYFYELLFGVGLLAIVVFFIELVTGGVA